MLLTLCKGTLHRPTVTQAALHYVGSITIAADLMEAAGLVLWEKVQVGLTPSQADDLARHPELAEG